MAIQINLVSSENGFHDFDVQGAGFINRVTVSNDIQRGDMFNIYHGYSDENSRKSTGIWLGDKGIGGYLTGDLEKSIRRSDVFIGETMDSDYFYAMVAKKHCKCNCKSPSVRSRYENRTLIAVDLDSTEFERESSRFNVYTGSCISCGELVTFGNQIGSFNSTGLDHLKDLAVKEHRGPIEWGNVITSRDQL
ncbi:conserved hypothetical protein [Vibrio jasicida]|uniref:Uncharacterized protein n=1 Tax=Vibrio jasicida TaxID=766224 RepID=A0AAU9QSA7_9VIBR|nr:hypothetical protein [Vibrio coralliilyticus]PAW02438.1 hypothetical protein CKJ79_17390 [Vibrio coralliilyticus]CAH1588469.1 conserved hypothetical protein [Vibrio jasicida]CAH1599810.1 conserved hypothetical protein [Vibrio jasicida]